MTVGRLYWRLMCAIAGGHIPDDHPDNHLARRWARPRCRRCGTRLDR